MAYGYKRKRRYTRRRRPVYRRRVRRPTVRRSRSIFAPRTPGAGSIPPSLRLLADRLRDDPGLVERLTPTGRRADKQSKFVFPSWSKLMKAIKAGKLTYDAGMSIYFNGLDLSNSFQRRAALALGEYAWNAGSQYINDRPPGGWSMGPGVDIFGTNSHGEL